MFIKITSDPTYSWNVSNPISLAALCFIFILHDFYPSLIHFDSSYECFFLFQAIRLVTDFKVMSMKLLWVQFRNCPSTSELKTKVLLSSTSWERCLVATLEWVSLCQNLYFHLNKNVTTHITLLSHSSWRNVACMPGITTIDWLDPAWHISGMAHGCPSVTWLVASQWTFL